MVTLTKILRHRCVSGNTINTVKCFKHIDSDILILFQTLVQVVVCIHYYQHYLVAMATFLSKSENEVQINHLHPKRVHTVKGLQNSVQYIWRYSNKYASFFGRVIPEVHICAL